MSSSDNVPIGGKGLSTLEPEISVPDGVACLLVATLFDACLVGASAVECVCRFSQQPLLVVDGKKVEFFFDHAKADGLAALRIFRETRTAQHAFGTKCFV